MTHKNIEQLYHSIQKDLSKIRTARTNSSNTQSTQNYTLSFRQPFGLIFCNKINVVKFDDKYTSDPWAYRTTTVVNTKTTYFAI